MRKTNLFAYITNYDGFCMRRRVYEAKNSAYGFGVIINKEFKSIDHLKLYGCKVELYQW